GCWRRSGKPTTRPLYPTSRSRIPARSRIFGQSNSIGCSTGRTQSGTVWPKADNTLSFCPHIPPVCSWSRSLSTWLLPWRNPFRIQFAIAQRISSFASWRTLGNSQEESLGIRRWLVEDLDLLRRRLARGQRADHGSADACRVALLRRVRWCPIF